MNCSQIVISTVNFYTDLWSTLALVPHSTFQQTVGQGCILRWGCFSCFGILFWRIFLGLLLFLSFFQMSTLLIFCLNVLNRCSFPFSWADRCIVPMDISWSQSIKLSSKLKDSLKTWKLHSHGLGGIAEWGKMSHLKVQWVTKKIINPKYYFSCK